jgi:uncharacterized membrane protein affecting hemolysin expression
VEDTSREHIATAATEASQSQTYGHTMMMMIIIIIIIIIQFLYVQNVTAQRPITKLAQARKWEE